MIAAYQNQYLINNNTGLSCSVNNDTRLLKKDLSHQTQLGLNMKHNSSTGCAVWNEKEIILMENRLIEVD